MGSWFDLLSLTAPLSPGRCPVPPAVSSLQHSVCACAHAYACLISSPSHSTAHPTTSLQPSVVPGGDKRDRTWNIMAHENQHKGRKRSSGPFALMEIFLSTEKPKQRRTTAGPPGESSVQLSELPGDTFPAPARPLMGPLRDTGPQAKRGRAPSATHLTI